MHGQGAQTPTRAPQQLARFGDRCRRTFHVATVTDLPTLGRRAIPERRWSYLP